MKIKKYLIPLVALVLVVTVTTALLVSNAVTSAEVSRLLTPPQFDKGELDLDSELSAFKPADFSAKNNAGKNYVKKAESEYLELYHAELPYLEAVLEESEENPGSDIEYGLPDIEYDEEPVLDEEYDEEPVLDEEYDEEPVLNEEYDEEPVLDEEYGEETDYTEEDFAAEYEGEDEKYIYVEHESKKRHDVAVYDKRSGKLWRALANEDDYIEEDYAINLTDQFQSLVSFSYIDVNEDRLDTYDTSVISELAEITVEDIFNENGTPSFGENTNGAEQYGIRISYDIAELGISFCVDFKLGKDFLDVSVPDDMIKEDVNDIYDQVEDAKRHLRSTVTRLQNLSGNLLNRYRGRGDRDSEIIRTQVEMTSQRIIDLSGDTHRNNYDSLMIYVDELLDMLEDYGEPTERAEEIKQELTSLEEYIDYLAIAALCGIFKFDVMPFFGAGNDSTNGYVFYPDGCGAISHFNRFRAPAAKRFASDVYSNNILSMSTYTGWSAWDDEEEQEDLTSIRMPVFGIKHEKDAFVAVIAQGDSNAAITFEPPVTTHVSYAYASFYFRVTTQETRSDGNTNNIIDPKRANQPRTMRYYFLERENADYSGMAVKYRDFLESYDLIRRSPVYDQENMPIDIRLVMGVLTEETSATEQYTKLTTFPEAEKIYSTLQNKGVKSINSVLEGWSTAGWYGRWPDYDRKPDSSTGGVNGLRKLTSFAKNNNIDVSVTVDNLFGCTRNGMKNSDVDSLTIKNPGGFSVNYRCDFLYSPFAVFNRGLETARKVQGYGVDSIQYYSESTLLYVDYNKNAPLNREDSKDVFIELARQTKDAIGGVKFGYSNIYMAKYADFFRNAPNKGYEFLFTDEEVPFYQMVLHGFVPYSGLHFNSMHDVDFQTLKSIEFGFIPSYILTYDQPNLKTSYSSLFATKAEDWYDKIADVYQMYETRLSGLWKEKMMKIEDVRQDLKRITYESGTKVYLNYSDKDVTFDGIEIKAMDFNTIPA